MEDQTNSADSKFKKDDASENPSLTQDPSNYRPISISCTIYKIFASILASRLKKKAWSDKILHPYQKGLADGNGCAQHIYLLRKRIHQARNSKKDPLHISFLDVRKAFDTVPHSEVFRAVSNPLLEMGSHDIQFM